MRPTRYTTIPGVLVAAFAISVGGTTTAQPVEEQSPGPRYGHEMVYDAARGEVILFGGFGPDGEPKGDTWAWNGNGWRPVADTGPSPRKWPAAAYDSRRELIVLHGGREGAGRSGPSLSDTWIWDGRKWQQASANGPTPRDHHRAAYDEARDRVVLFGGWNGDSLENDTWEWDGDAWKRVATDGPGPRAPFGMAYHKSLEAVVIAGGQDLDGAFDDMWRWNGSAWNRIENQLPSARGFHAMTSVPDTESVIVFGGRNGDELLNDLWEWDGRRWRQISSDGPVRRGIHACAYDARRRELIVHGSGDRVGNNWILESETWAWSADTGWRLLASDNVRPTEER